MPAVDDHICLCHISQPGNCKHLRIMPSEAADELLSKAQSGDTLHKVLDCVRFDIELLMMTIEQQIQENDYVRVP